MSKLSKVATRRCKGADVWKKGGRYREGGRDWIVYIEIHMATDRHQLGEY